MMGNEIGHGHVFPRLDGAKARCGGPAMCKVCKAEEALIARLQALKSAPNQPKPIFEPLPTPTLPGANQVVLEWAVERWNSEVRHRPQTNIHRETLDTLWRQVIRWAGGDDRELLGPTHGELMKAADMRNYTGNGAKEGW